MDKNVTSGSYKCYEGIGSHVKEQRVKGNYSKR